MSFADNLRAVRKERNICRKIWLSKNLNVSLDDLISDEIGSQPFDQQQPQTQTRSATGRIIIVSQDKKVIVNCYKVVSFYVVGSKKKTDEPQYILFGVGGRSLLDENRIFLGWYANEEDVAKEQKAIMAAIANGETSYDLKYAAKVKKKGLFGIKLEE